MFRTTVLKENVIYIDILIWGYDNYDKNATIFIVVLAI